MMGNLMGDGLDPFHTLSPPPSVIRCHGRFGKRRSHETTEWTTKDRTATHTVDEATSRMCGVAFSFEESHGNDCGSCYWSSKVDRDTPSR